MNITLNENELRLMEPLMAMPPDLTAAERLLEQEQYTSESISRVGTNFVWECRGECWDHFRENDVLSYEDVVPGLHSTYLCEVLSLLLRYGLDPNAIFADENIMDDLRYLDNGYVAADALVLLMEHGGDPNLICEGHSIFTEIDFCVLFDAREQEDRRRYASLVHCWMVHLAFGATNSDGSAPVTASPGFDIRELKDHRQYYFGITKGESTWPDIHIFDRRDMWEVART